jgi:hypothetical protein
MVRAKLVGLSTSVALVGLLASGCSSDGNDGGTPDGAVDAPMNRDVATDTTSVDGGDAKPGDADLDVGRDATADLAGDTSDTSGPLSEARSYTAVATFTLTPGPGASNLVGRPLPSQQTLVVHIDPIAKQITFGAAGTAARTPAQSSDGFRFATTTTVSLPVPTTFCGASLQYTTMSFVVAGDQLSGQGSGRMTLIDGDIAYDLTAAIIIAGSVDRTPPNFGPDRADVEPLPDLFLPASEPLQPQTKGRLVAGAESIDLAAHLPGNLDLVAGFHKRQRALRYGTTYEIVAEPGNDLHRNAVAVRTKVTTVAAPVLVPEDGFESAGDMLGGVSVVTAARLPPISGQKSVVVLPRWGFPIPVPNATGSHLAVRLAIAAGDTTVKFSLRAVGGLQSTASTYGTAIRVAVPGGAITQATLPQSEPLTEEFAIPGSAGGSSRVYLGATRMVTIPLPTAASNEVVFDVVVGPDTTACGLLPPTAGYLIDDLRVE